MADGQWDLAGAWKSAAGFGDPWPAQEGLAKEFAGALRALDRAKVREAIAKGWNPHLQIAAAKKDRSLSVPELMAKCPKRMALWLGERPQDAWLLGFGWDGSEPESSWQAMPEEARRCALAGLPPGFLEGRSGRGDIFMALTQKGRRSFVQDFFKSPCAEELKQSRQGRQALAVLAKRALNAAWSRAERAMAVPAGFASELDGEVLPLRELYLESMAQAREKPDWDALRGWAEILALKAMQSKELAAPAVAALAGRFPESFCRREPAGRPALPFAAGIKLMCAQGEAVGKTVNLDSFRIALSQMLKQCSAAAALENRYAWDQLSRLRGTLSKPSGGSEDASLPWLEICLLADRREALEALAPSLEKWDGPIGKVQKQVHLVSPSKYARQLESQLAKVDRKDEDGDWRIPDPLRRRAMKKQLAEKFEELRLAAQARLALVPNLPAELAQALASGERQEMAEGDAAQRKAVRRAHKAAFAVYPADVEICRAHVALLSGVKPSALEHAIGLGLLSPGSLGSAARALRALGEARYWSAQEQACVERDELALACGQGDAAPDAARKVRI